jgi:hypothetical protein
LSEVATALSTQENSCTENAASENSHPGEAGVKCTVKDS